MRNRKPSPATVLAVVVLIAALGGTAVASIAAGTPGKARVTNYAARAVVTETSPRHTTILEIPNIAVVKSEECHLAGEAQRNYAAVEDLVPGYASEGLVDGHDEGWGWKGMSVGSPGEHRFRVSSGSGTATTVTDVTVDLTFVTNGCALTVTAQIYRG
jgi:hypothetical protein